MHRVIYERIIGRPLLAHEQIDHVNHNKCDNRRSNLRLATIEQNRCNTPLRSNNRSGYKGVYFRKNANKRPWAAQIALRGDQKHLGRFATPEEAARAYDKAARELHGEFAYLNFPDKAEQS